MIIDILSNFLKSVCNFILSIGKLGLMLIVLIALFFGFLVYTTNRPFKESIDKWYGYDENYQENTEEEEKETQHDHCRDSKILASNIASFYAKILSGTDISANLSIICNAFECDKEIMANNISDLQGSIAMSKQVNDMINNFEESMDRFSQKINIRKRIYIMRKTSQVNEIKSKNDLIISLYSFANEIYQLQYSNALKTLSLIESSGILQKENLTKLNKIKLELETVITIQEVLQIKNDVMI